MALMFLVIMCATILFGLWAFVQCCGYLGLWLDKCFGFYMDEMQVFGIIALAILFLLSAFAISRT